jgi:putative acetyltransferase
LNLNEILIRDETPADHDTITTLTEKAFATMEISDHTEQFIVQALRKANALTVSLVAELEGQVVGHIAFSPVTLTDGTPGWYGMGPVSVLPSLQRMGIGKTLVNAGLERLKSLGARGCVLVGHPEYYTKFGFHNTPNLGLKGSLPKCSLPSLDGRIPTGNVTFHEAFGAHK